MDRAAGASPGQKKDPGSLSPEEIGNLLQAEMPVLWRFARSLSGSPDRADDLVQDTMERALSRFDTFTPGTNLRAWLFTILRNSHINNIRRARQTYEPPEVMDVLMPPVQASQEHSLMIRDLSRGLGQLSQDMRDVVLLVGMEGTSYDDAARILGVRVGTVKSRLCRGRDALRSHMDSGRASH
ncbi:MAG: sigma-70 family RNA polymerase sigma factor [Pseudomonadota bacterium]|nr:sigma-70 family RNA polymerase sigma factor [Pseudomonadota bacterium]